MAANISLFPVITDDLLSKTRFQASPYQLYYVRDDQEYVLRTEEVDSSTIVHKVIDDEGIWSPDDYQLCIRRKYSIRTYQCLFGSNGIACNNAKLGIALMWTSPDSKQRGVIPIGEIENFQRDLETKTTSPIYVGGYRTKEGAHHHYQRNMHSIFGQLAYNITEKDEADFNFRETWTEDDSAGNGCDQRGAYMLLAQEYFRLQGRRVVVRRHRRRRPRHSTRRSRRQCWREARRRMSCRNRRTR